MDYLKQFVIPFSGLSIGDHQYKFIIDKKFFENFDFSEIKNGKITVDLLLNKQENMLILNFIINGTVNVTCDRCLEPFDLDIYGKEKLIIKFGKEKFEETEEILIIPESDNRINISHYIYEYINLLLPYKRVHPDNANGKSTCNQEVIKKFKEFSKSKTIDPRWEKLKDIKLK